MIAGRIAGAFSQYLVPIVFAVGAVVGGATAYTIQGGRVAVSQKQLAEERLSCAKQKEDAANTAISNHLEAQRVLNEEAARISEDIRRGQVAAASETVRIRKKLSELSQQQDFACLRSPLPDDVLDGLRRN